MVRSYSSSYALWRVALLFAIAVSYGATSALGITPCTTDPPDCPVCQKAACDNTKGQWKCNMIANGSACDDGDQCTYGDHCTGGTCTGTVIGCANTSCATRACNGTSACTVNYLPSMTLCRGLAGSCDVAEYCTGSSLNCPADVVLSLTRSRRHPGYATRVILAVRSYSAGLT